ncbi:BppU family phage baseplate upper protein [Bacillus altitudinis]|uniref:BppU family phage baseplate upper protein n=1 Tax=Bacillus altitudinis TaxID=293387 RepID=UPI003D0188B7
MTNQLFKNGVLPFVVDAYDQSVYDSKIVFSTQDIGTGKLIFKMRKDGVPLPLSAVDGKLVLKFANGSKNIRNITLIDKVEGIAEYVLDNDEIKLYGKVQASLNLYYRNGQALSIHEFTFDIQRNLIDQDIAPAAEFYIDDFQSLKKQIERMAAELEADIQKRTDDMQGNIDEITKELQEQLDKMKEKLDDLEALETKQGAQDKVDKALAAAKKYTDDHATDQKIHVTEDKQKAWDAKETTSGAQTKANKALSDAKSYTDELSKKAQMYKLTTDAGFRQAVPTTIGGTNLFELPPGFYYGAGQYFTNLPTTNDTSWFNVDVFTTGIRKNFHVIRSADNTHWFGTIHTDGSFKGWKRMLTDTDANSKWEYPTIVNGWKTYKSEVNNDYRVRYTKDAFGWVHITGAIAGGTLGDVAAFVLDEGYRPSTPLYNVGLASSTGGASGPQICRQYIATDGRFCIQTTSSNTEFIVVNFSFKV